MLQLFYHPDWERWLVVRPGMLYVTAQARKLLWCDVVSDHATREEAETAIDREARARALEARGGDAP